MRKVIYAINITLDGCCDHTHGGPDEELMEYFTNLVRDAGLFVYGRKTYELMVPYWPDIAKSDSETKVDKDFAEAFVSKKKVVFSRSLASAEGDNTRIVRTNLQDEILKLKQEPGKNILVGGADIPSQLIALGLVDDFVLSLCRYLQEKGNGCSKVLAWEKLQLKLVESRVFKSSGSVLLHYLKQ